MVFADALDPVLSDPAPFTLAITPVMLYFLGGMALLDDEHGLFAKLCVTSGVFGVGAVSSMNGLAVWTLRHSPPRADGQLIAFGVGVGILSTIVYLFAVTRWMKRHHAARRPFPHNKTDRIEEPTWRIQAGHPTSGRD